MSVCRASCRSSICPIPNMIRGLIVLVLLQCALSQKMILTKGQHFRQQMKKMQDARTADWQNQRTEHNAQSSETSQHGRSLKQQSSNEFGACPANRYIYPGPTMDSIFDQLTTEEYQSAAQAVADKFGYIIPYGYFDVETTAATPVVSPQSSLTGDRSVGVNLTGAPPPPGSADEEPLYNTADTPGLYDPSDPTLNQNLTTYDDYLYNAYLYPVDKRQALAYLDNGGTLPDRYAKVIVVRGSVPDVMEYKVGPLPMGPNSEILPLFENGTIPFTKRPSNDLPEAITLGGVGAYVQGMIKNLSIAWIGQCGDYTDTDCDYNNITAMQIEVPTREKTRDERLSVIIHFLQVGAGSAFELHSLPFAYKINTTSQDPADWTFFEFEFCGQGFPDVDALVEAYVRGNLTICRPLDWIQPQYDASWAETKSDGPLRNDLQKAGPRLYEPGGKRFKILQGDSQTSRVFQWGDWQGHVSTHPWTGITFHDIRFKGDRIAYELSLNDQIVAYSGYTTAGQTFYLDSFDMLGASQYTLQPGYDCPETASYMPVNMMAVYGNSFQANQSICMFESYGETTSWRHFDGESVKNVRQYAFVVRTVMTLGNYDYIATVSFQLDGTVKVQVHMAGYMQTLYYDTEVDFSQKDLKYGTRVWKNTIGNIHDHLSSWKVDLDIKGVNNSFHTLAVKTGTYEEALGPGQTPSWALPTDVMKYEQDTKVEQESAFVLNYREPTVYRFVNENSTNRWGVPQGYGIFHGYTSTQLLPASHPLNKAAAWSKYHIAVTQRKENESQSHNDIYDSHSPGDPVYSLDTALNNETIVDQDLVAWVSMGIIHIPRSEDVPLITNVGTEFELRPVNYFDRLASMDVEDSDEFQACAAEQGSESSFDYVYGGDNLQGNKAGFKYSGALSSSNEFDVTRSPATAPSSSFVTGPAAASAG